MIIVRNTPVEMLVNILNRKGEECSPGPYTLGDISLNSNNPKFLFYQNRDKRVDFLKESERMNGQYLGACLDYVRIGAMNACFWKLGGVKGLTGFIKEWVDLNRENLLWSDKPIPKNLELPLIQNSSCPRDKKHTERMIDRLGIVRCIHTRISEMKPSTIHEEVFFDEFANMNKNYIREELPYQPQGYYDDKNEYVPPDIDDVREYELAMKKIESEKKTEVRDVCYSIISEPKERVFSLERVLTRLNIAPTCEADRRNGSAGYPFCGWTMAWYVQKWYEQSKDGNKDFFMKLGEEEGYRVFKDFRVFTSDD